MRPAAGTLRAERQIASFLVPGVHAGHGWPRMARSFLDAPAADAEGGYAPGMPEEIGEVAAALLDRSALDRLSALNPPGRERSMRRLEDGLVALDLGDEGHVFRVRIERVPRRRWTPERPVRIGTVDGIEVALVSVTVDNFVHVHLTAADARTDQLSQDYGDALEEWTRTVNRGTFPEDAAQRLTRVVTAVADRLGTVYRIHGDQYGGTGTEWDAVQSFFPPPPAEVDELELSLRTPTDPPILISARLE